MKKTSNSDLLNALEASYNAETTVWPELYTSGKHLAGQCAATSLVIQDYLGGVIKSAIVRIAGVDEVQIQHYFNEVSGIKIDPTGKQFKDGVTHNDMTTVSREEIESTAEYNILKKRVEEYLQSQHIGD